MIFVSIIGFLCWSQHHSNRETGTDSNVLDESPRSRPQHYRSKGNWVRRSSPSEKRKETLVVWQFLMNKVWTMVATCIQNCRQEQGLQKGSRILRQARHTPPQDWHSPLLEMWKVLRRPRWQNLQARRDLQGWVEEPPTRWFPPRGRRTLLPGRSPAAHWPSPCCRCRTSSPPQALSPSPFHLLQGLPEGLRRKSLRLKISKLSITQKSQGVDCHDA